MPPDHRLVPFRLRLRLRLRASALAALVGLAGLALAPRAAGAAEPAASDPDADAVVDAAPAGEDRELDSAPQRAAYEHEHFVLLGGSGRARVRRGDLTLSGAELYRALGRDDLADKLRAGQGTRVFGGIVGAGLVVFGIYLARLDERDCEGSPRSMAESCRLEADEEHRTNVLYSVTSLVAGAGLLAVSILWTTPDPVDHAQLDRIVAHANWRLRRRLGVVDVAAVPSVASDGGGLVLVGRF